MGLFMYIVDFVLYSILIGNIIGDFEKRKFTDIGIALTISKIIVAIIIPVIILYACRVARGAELGAAFIVAFLPFWLLFYALFIGIGGFIISWVVILIFILCLPKLRSMIPKGGLFRRIILAIVIVIFPIIVYMLWLKWTQIPFHSRGILGWIIPI